MNKRRRSRGPNVGKISAKKSTCISSNPFAKHGNTGLALKINPFEVHVNKEKFHILERKCKHDKGLPGVSRAKAAKKRRATLGQEYHEQNKKNKFKDRRFGKYNIDSEIAEELVDVRYAVEKSSQFKERKLRFDLNYDEVLTHQGQTLEDVQEFCGVHSDDDFDEEDALNAKFTERINFGDGTDQGDRKAAIENMILETKRRKAELVKDKNEVHELTETLDGKYKEIVGLMNKFEKKELTTKPTNDNYDKIMREMIFEPRVEVTEKFVSLEEKAEREKCRIDQIEQERLMRMRDDGETSAKEHLSAHRSADALDGSYFDDAVVDDEGEILTYNLDGELIGSINRKEAETSEIGDLESEKSDESYGEDVENNKAEEGESTDSAHLANFSEAGSISSKDYSNGMPSSYAQFNELIGSCSPEDQIVVVDRLIKCNHPKLVVGNSERIAEIFSFLVQYIHELFTDPSPENVELNFRIVGGLSPLIYDLIQLNANKFAIILLGRIQQEYAKYIKAQKSYPSLEIFVLLKLISNLFSNSDFRHPVMTPCFIFAQHVLARARVKSCQDIARGLFLVNIMLECTQLSHRFLPGVFNYLLGIIYLAIPKHSTEVIKIIPPFERTGPFSKILAIETTNEDLSTEQLMTSRDLVTTTLATNFKVRALNTALKLIKTAIEIASKNIGANYLAASMLEMFDRLPLSPYPSYVTLNFTKTRESLEVVAGKSLTKFISTEKRLKSLRLLEPRIEPVYDDKRRPKLAKKVEERAKLLHKVKRERKGAIREIRRDTDFLQKIRIQKQIQSDLERKEKVKRIFHEGTMQQGELNELARAKKKKKF